MALRESVDGKRWRYRAAPHQVAGHLFEEGKCGSLVCERGFFYKPMQCGPRGERERDFYEKLTARMAGGSECSGSGNEDDGECVDASSLQVLSGFVPKFFGLVDLNGVTYMKMEDLARQYRFPCIMDVKIGFRTWYASADEAHIQKWMKKDAATTTSSLGFKVCGMQVYNKEDKEYWKASKKWCKTLDAYSVRSALRQFVTHPDVSTNDIYCGQGGLQQQLESLEQWAGEQKHFHFYSASVLILYEGDATCPEDINVNVKIIDFAHTMEACGKKDKNFVSGLASFRANLDKICDS